MKILNENEFEEIINEIAGAIAEIKGLRNSFDPVKLRLEIVEEFKKTLSQKNSLFKSLRNESLELDKNLIVLKQVRKEFLECKTKTLATVGVSALIGGIFVALILKIYGL